LRDYDVVLLHPPAILNETGPMPSVQYVIMPMGEFAIASQLERENYSVKLVNFGLEKKLDASYDVLRWIRSIESKIYAIDLHWAVHSSGAVKLADLCKKYHPESLVVLGGFTATWFHERILAKYASVDAIVLGEAEDTFSQLVRRAAHGRELKDVLGIAYRSGGIIKRNQMAKPIENLDGLDYANLRILENWRSYLRMDSSGNEQNRRPYFWLNLARGCCYNCVHCGGGMDAYRVFSTREKMAFRSPTRVAEDIERLYQLGVRQISFSHDPEIAGEKYQTRLLDEIRKRHFDISLYYESLRVPSRAFLEKINRVSYDTTVAISPDSPSEEVRIAAGRGFTNAQMMNAIEDCEDLGIKADIYYMVGLPGETIDFLSMFKEVLAKMSHTIWTCVFPPIPYTIDPNCPMATNPEKYGVKLLYRTFDDYEAMSLMGYDWSRSIGHETAFLTREDILELTRQAHGCAMRAPVSPIRRDLLEYGGPYSTR
jgi:B12-binding domain/radical SAM domain protein